QGDYRLPCGPLLLSPDRLFTSFHREVIMRRPQEFKMACLRDIRNLFGDQQNPFYAGFGNRITDAMSYRSVNVPVSRICTIDSYGEIKLDLLPGYRSSYVKINDLVDMMFPPLSSKLDPTFNDWEYWKRGLPEIEDELAEIDALLAAEEEREKEAKKKKASSPANKSIAPVSPSTTASKNASGFTRNMRSASNASGSPTMHHLTPDQLATVYPAQQMLYQGNVRQRADSWTTTGGGGDTPMDLLTSGPLHPTMPGRGMAGQPDPEPSLANGAGRNRMSLLKKASSAFSPFNLVRGSSPPLPAGEPFKFDYNEQQQPLSSSSAEEQISSASSVFPQLSASKRKPKYVSAASTFSYTDDQPIEANNNGGGGGGGGLGQEKQSDGTNLSFNFTEMREADDTERMSMDEGDGEVDPLVAVAASMLVPQFGETRMKNINDNGKSVVSSSRVSIRSSEYSDEEDVDTDIDDEQEDDVEDDDDDEPIDQEMLDIMHDMEQVQRLE
ncbi:lipin Ned1, partial [Coemansia asiatica]